MSIAEHFKEFQQKVGETRPETFVRNREALVTNGMCLAICTTGRNDGAETICVVSANIFVNGLSGKRADQSGYFHLFTGTPDNFKLSSSIAGWCRRKDDLVDVYINTDQNISKMQREIAVAYVLDRVTRVPNKGVQFKTKLE